MRPKPVFKRGVFLYNGPVSFDQQRSLNRQEAPPMGQTLADRVLIAKSSDGEMNDLLREYRPFILSAVLTNSPKAEEDYVQAGMLAFAQAVRTFEPGKGSFLSFAKLLISRRVIDCIRQDTAKPKVLEDHRRYLVAAVLVHSGDYPFIREYIRLDSTEGGEGL